MLRTHGGSSRVSDLVQKRQTYALGKGNVVSDADNLSFPSGEVNKTKRIKSPHLGLRNDDDDKANSSKKISLKIVDESLCKIVISVLPSYQADQAVQGHAELQQQAGA